MHAGLLARAQPACLQPAPSNHPGPRGIPQPITPKETDGWKSGRKKKQKAVFSPASNRTTSQIESTVHSFQRRQWRQSPRSSSSPTARSPPGLPAGAPPSPPFSSQTPTVRLTLRRLLRVILFLSDPLFLLAKSAQGMSRMWCSDSMTWNRTW